MRQLFGEYYVLTGEEIDALWPKSDIVLDTNVLLNLYRYSAATRDELLSVLSGFKTQLWLPMQVAAEYHRRRADVILDQLRVYKAARDAFGGVRSGLSETLHEFLSRGQHPTINLKSYLDRIEEVGDAIVEELRQAEEAHPDLLQNDAVRDQLDKLFEGRVGVGFTPDTLPELFKRARERYDKQIPPGYKDAKKPGDEQFGDYLVWQEILDHACEVKRPVIFVTDDVKEDWWWRVRGRTLGARPELLRELREKAATNLHMYSADRFMQFGVQYLNRKPADKAIEEVRDLRRGNDQGESAAAKASGSSFDTTELSRRIAELLSRIADHSDDSGRTTDIARWRQAIVEGTLDKPRVGDRVQVLIHRRDDASGTGKDYDIVIGQGQAIEGLETAIRSLSVGEEGTFEIDLPSFMPDGPKGRVGQFFVKLLAIIKSPPVGS